MSPREEAIRGLAHGGMSEDSVIFWSDRLRHAYQNSD